MIVTVDNKEKSLNDERSESHGFDANFKFTESFKFWGHIIISARLDQWHYVYVTSVAECLS